MPKPSTEAQRARSALGAAVRHGDPAQIEQARQDLAAAHDDALVKATVDRASYLTPAQYEELAAALAQYHADAGDAA